ncbi:amidase [Cohaesibacter gelatinilyticus]|uniref:Indoleacetamide hydrolase n=1 Tax=Cohaesibacter gelatinilyticus TaxID=372072 RepID=A0A285PHR3_9HYPH|nr:amidase [Cohaesibacter gelatinilyticus]SNZ21272.1 amidase [Cohaesibacter gelatinilyticus]
MSKPIWQWSALETRDAVREHRVSVLEVVQAQLDHMRRTNPSINAITIDLGDHAIKQAKASDEALACGVEPGPLHGVPVTLKHNIDIAGLPNSSGVAALADNIAWLDAPVVKRLYDAGAVCIGLTNTPEFSMRAFTDNPLYGLTLNPWDEAITCGGSSGGAGAALASGIGTLAHGNDIGGSLRYPAHFNGVVAIKPGLGRVAHHNASAPDNRPIGMQLFSSQGPMARNVADARLFLDVISGFDIRDPWSVASASDLDVKNIGANPVRVAVAKVPGSVMASAAVMGIIRQAADWLDNAGYEVEEVTLPDLDPCWQNWWDILYTELCVAMRDDMLSMGGKDFKTSLSFCDTYGRMLDLPDYMAAFGKRLHHLRVWCTFMEDYPLVLTPLVAQDAPSPRGDIESEEQSRAFYQDSARFIGIVNYLGLPAAAVPAGLSNGHPVGVQLIGRALYESQVLDAAAIIENQAGILVETLWERSNSGV